MVAATVVLMRYETSCCCDLLKIYYLCGSSNSKKPVSILMSCVVICLKFTTFVVAATVVRIGKVLSTSCDLLKIYYLCGSSNSVSKILLSCQTVVICLKFTTFVVAATVGFNRPYPTKSCDLLKIYYLCGSSNSIKKIRTSLNLVVICLKFTTFVVAATV